MKSIFKYINRDTKELVKNKLNALSLFKYRLISYRPLFAKIYYLFNHKVSSELYTLTNGIYEHKKNQFNSGRFRRNIHRIEKGLIMRPRRSSFGLSYMHTVLKDYSLIVTNVSEESKWATSVLDKYFEVCTGREVEKLKKIYLSIRLKDVDEDSWVEVMRPYQHKKKDSVVSQKDLLNLCSSRSSVRWYKDEIVDNIEVEKAMDIAKTAPSACNRQPFRFVATKDKEMIRILGGLAPGTSGFLNNIPNLMCVVGDLKNYESERDRHIIYIDSSLATMQLLLAFETKGISSCILNWAEDYDKDKEISKRLKLSKSERVIFLIAFGYADNTGSIPFSVKKENNNLLKFI